MVRSANLAIPWMGKVRNKYRSVWNTKGLEMRNGRAYKSTLGYSRSSWFSEYRFPQIMSLISSFKGWLGEAQTMLVHFLKLDPSIYKQFNNVTIPGDRYSKGWMRLRYAWASKPAPILAVAGSIICWRRSMRSPVAGWVLRNVGSDAPPCKCSRKLINPMGA